MAKPDEPIRIHVHIERATVRRALVVGGSLILFAAAGVGLAVPVTFSDGQVLTAQQLNDNFADLEQRIGGSATSDKSGSRIKGKYLLGSDGSRQYELVTLPTITGWPFSLPTLERVWYDSQLSADCTYEAASDGTLRCLPVGFREDWFHVYLDAACSKLIVKVIAPPAGCTAPATPQYYRSPPDPVPYCGPPANGLAIRVHKLVGPAPATLPTPLFEPAGDGTCQPSTRISGLAGGSGQDWFEFGPEEAPSGFVQGTRTIDP